MEEIKVWKLLNGAEITKKEIILKTGERISRKQFYNKNGKYSIKLQNDFLLEKAKDIQITEIDKILYNTL